MNYFVTHQKKVALLGRHWDKMFAKNFAADVDISENLIKTIVLEKTNSDNNDKFLEKTKEPGDQDVELSKHLKLNGLVTIIFHSKNFLKKCCCILFYYYGK